MTASGLPARAETVFALCNPAIDLFDALEWSTSTERLDAIELIRLSRDLILDERRLLELRAAFLFAEAERQLDEDDEA